MNDITPMLDNYHYEADKLYFGDKSLEILRLGEDG